MSLHVQSPVQHASMLHGPYYICPSTYSPPNHQGMHPYPSFNNDESQHRSIARHTAEESPLSPSMSNLHPLAPVIICLYTFFSLSI